MKKIIFNILKNICVVYLLVSMFLALGVFLESKKEIKAISQNNSTENLAIAEMIDEQAKIYNTDNSSKAEIYSKLLSSTSFVVTCIPFVSVFAAIVMGAGFTVVDYFLNKSSVQKLNEKLNKK